jgi:mannosyltransferase OCH1-like enzyme
MTDRHLNGTFKRVFLRDADCVHVSIKADVVFPGFRSCFDSLIPWAYKTDLVRLWLLHQNGGIWMDLTTELMVPISVLTDKGTDLILAHERMGFGMNNGIFTAVMGARRPNSSFFYNAIIQVLRMCNSQKYGATPWSITGPDILGQVFLSQKRKESVLWLQHRQSGGFLDLNSVPVAVTKHVSDAVRHYKSNVYINAWKKKKVYRTTPR